MHMNPRELGDLACSRLIPEGKLPGLPHQRKSMGISEQRYFSGRTSLRNHCTNHDSRAVEYYGLCAVCRQLCLEADSWSP